MTGIQYCIALAGEQFMQRTISLPDFLMIFIGSVLLSEDDRQFLFPFLRTVKPAAVQQLLNCYG